LKSFSQLWKKTCKLKAPKWAKPLKKRWRPQNTPYNGVRNHLAVTQSVQLPRIGYRGNKRQVVAWPIIVQKCRFKRFFRFDHSKAAFGSILSSQCALDEGSCLHYLILIYSFLP
jgi:hypothetical protein